MFKNLLSRITKAAEQTPYSVQFLSPGSMSGAPPRLGTTDLLTAYSNMPWLRAIVNKIGKSVGITEWRLYAVTSQGPRSYVKPTRLQRCADHRIRNTMVKDLREKGKLEEIEEHPLLDLLYHPNSELSSIVNFQLIQQYMDLVGEAYWIIERDGLGMPMSLWPLPPSWIRSLPSSNRPTYKISIETFSEIEVPMSEIIKFNDPDPYNPYGRGTGIAKSLGDELETDEFAAKHLKGFFYNRAKPDLIISGDTLSREDTKRLEEKWQQKHRGFWNAYKPHFLSRRVDIKELGQSFENMQLTELRKHERDTCIQVYGVPPEKLGIVNESKRATISAADLFWTKDILLPRVETIRTVIQDQLVPMYDNRLLLDFESPVVQDQELTLKMMQASPWAYSLDEWRTANGYPESGEEIGKMYLMPSNMALVSGAGEVQLLVGGQSTEEESQDETPPDTSEEEENGGVLAASLSNYPQLATIDGKDVAQMLLDNKNDIANTVMRDVGKLIKKKKIKQ